MIKEIEFINAKEYFKNLKEKAIFANEVFEDLKNKKFGIYNEDVLCGLIFGNNDFYYLFLDDNYSDIEEINDFLKMNFIKEIISDKRFEFANEKTYYFLIKRADSNNVKSSYYYPFENNIEKIKLQYELLKKCNFSLPEFDEFYLSLFYKNKKNILRLYGIFKDNLCVCSAIISYMKDNIAKLTSIATSSEYRKMGLAEKILKDIFSDVKLKNKDICLLCGNEKALNLYSKVGFEVKENLYGYEL